MRYFTTEGRLRRLHYWFHIMGIVFAFKLVDKVTVSTAAAYPITTISALFIAMVFLYWMVSNIMTQRLHDCDRSAWWQLVYFVPVLSLTAVSMTFGFMGVGSDADIAAMDSFVAASGTVLNLFIWIPKGTSGPNQYGPDPLVTT